MGCDAGLLKLWHESILALFLMRKLIDQDRAVMIRSWVHSGFSVESETRMLDNSTREALGQYAARGAVSEQRISCDSSADVVTWSARANGFFDGKVETFNEDVNAGVYKCGFAHTQAAYDEAFDVLFRRLDELDHHLATHRFLFGDHLTDTDIRLFTPLVRFDIVYYSAFRTNWKRIAD